MAAMAAIIPDRPDVDDATLRAFATFFGIHEERGENGATRWTVQVESNQPGVPPQLASFDHKSQTWRLNCTIPPLQSEEIPPSPAAREGEHNAPATSPPSQADSHSLETDWTGTLPDTEHVNLIRSIDWSKTSLGPLASWPATLRLYLHMCLPERRPACIYWGTKRIAIYNENFATLLGGRHPSFLGSSLDKTWPDVFDKFKDIFHQVERTGAGCQLNNYPRFLNRQGYLEETYWTGDLFPLKEPDGSLVGCYFTWQETTRQVLQDRRARLIDEIGKPADESEVEVYNHMCAVFKDYPYDVPMAILYTAEDSHDEDENDADAISLRLQHTIGLATNHVAAPEILKLNKQTEGFGPALREARRTMAEWTVLDQVTESFPTEITAGIDWVGYQEVSRYIVVIPLMVVNKLLKGFIILGLNPRRELDADHRQYLSELSRQLQHVVTRITTAEQAKRREARLTQELAESERRIRRMAEMAPFGLYDLSAEGPLVWANGTFFEILASTHKDISRFDWRDVIHEEDQITAGQSLARGIIEKVVVSDTLRLKRTWQPPSSPNSENQPEEEPAWVLYQAYPHIENGEVTSLMGCLTDISSLKWAEKVQAKSAEAAQRSKQRQEDFIDITSHEIRNPLSAVTQCADGIHASLQEAQAMVNNPHGLLEIIKENAAAAESILLCAAHQRRIIDDVLTLSKLDSAILSVTPIPFRPDSIISETQLMFSADLNSSDIDLKIEFDSCEKFNFDDPVYCDPSRLMQILVNLITNAIKFTKSEKTRKITLRTGICDAPPTMEQFGPNFKWHSTNKERNDPTADAECGQGGAVYLYYAVVDSGQGISETEAPNIFDKFIQASRRTHIKYGGSGLGLFISRELTEMQGGQIGLRSKAGEGSTFAFYIKAKRAVLPSMTLMEESLSKKRSAGSLRISSGPHTPKARAFDLSNRSVLLNSGSAPPRTDYHILLVEDNELNQKVMAKQLRKAGCTVAVANHGEEAVDYLLRMHELPAQYGSVETEPVIPRLDCVLMDWEMPVCDGLQATRKIRELEKEGIFHDVQLILGVTANARSEQIQTAKNAGMQDVLPKPFKIPDLLNKIRTLVPDGDGDSEMMEGEETR